MTDPPYVNRCPGYDLARELLRRIYGPLRPRAAEPAGRLLAFDQTEFVPAGDLRHGLWHTGYLYVPPDCDGAAALPCRLHVVLHGCNQSAEAFQGALFPRSIGVNEWADANRILVLYPQARALSVGDFSPPDLRDRHEINLEGCWNWWGYGHEDRTYLFKDGIQIAAIWAMVQRMAGRSNR
jgi:poly(3-hydroxybutyrate) depolymerase